MLNHESPSQRARRIFHLITSQIPEERECGAREVAALLAVDFTVRTQLEGAFCAAAETANDAERAVIPQLSCLPDTVWRAWSDEHGSVRAVRRLHGHILAIRQRPDPEPAYSACLDGHYIKPQEGRFHPTYDAACSAAEREAMGTTSLADLQDRIDALLDAHLHQPA